MDFPTQETKRKTTAIPRLNKKLSFDSAVSFANEYQNDNLLNRSSSDPNHQSNRVSDYSAANAKNKNLCRFTLNENIVQNGKKEELEVSGCTESDEEVNSTIFNNKNNNICEDQETLEREDGTDNESPRKSVEEAVFTDEVNEVFYNDAQVNNLENIAATILTVTNASYHNVPPDGMAMTMQPTKMRNTLTQTEEEQLIRNRLMDLKKQKSPRPQRLQEAYLQQVGMEKHTQSEALNQLRWNIINPMYKNIALGNGIRPNIPLNPSVVSDIDVKTLTKQAEISDIDTDDDSVKMKDSPRYNQMNCGLYNMYNLAKTKDVSPNPSDERRHQTLVNTFIEVFGNDSHIIEKLRNNSPAKYDDRFRKFREDYQKREEKVTEVCLIQESPRDTGDYESCISKMQNLYKNDDVFSTITQSSNERSVVTESCRSKYSRPKSTISIKGCGCEIKHMQLNEVQKSIADIHNGMKTLLANFPPNTNSDVALELIKLRRLYEECLICQRKSSMQSKRLLNDIQNVYCSVVKLLESQKSSSFSFRYVFLPILGVFAYIIATQFQLCKKIPVNYE